MLSALLPYGKRAVSSNVSNSVVSAILSIFGLISVKQFGELLFDGSRA